MNTYICKHFGIKELVSPLAYERKGDKCWRWFSPDLLKVADRLQEKYGACYVNTWGLSNPNILGQVFSYSGFHLPEEYPKRSDFSGHRQWGSLDMKFPSISAEQIRIDLLGFEPTKSQVLPSIPGFEEITEIEYGVNWLHIRVGSNIDGVLVYPG